ncbi:CST complex subunit STN1 isoform X1 [Paramormyrops kingsleyae]|uniref:CST complex subunit STN1 isoform X1 n=1 Tax=Paramormyrops kingsleyae TaxID=1676925 RepID=UPI003B974B30
MQTEQGEHEPSSLLWGLDPVLSSFAKLYVKDILRMRESSQIPDVYFYKCHPLFKVDVLGTVVYKREREDFFCYGVDDGTGVINCLCWKDEKWRENTDAVNSGATLQVSNKGGFNPVEQLKKLKLAQKLSAQLEIGDLLRVRGSVKTSREQREIMACSYYKVNDPVMEVQISWMMEVLHLYRDFYDKPFLFTKSVQHLDTAEGDDLLRSLSVLRRASRLLMSFIREKGLGSFRPKDVQHLLMPLLSCAPSCSTTQQESTVAQSSSKQVHHLFRDVIKALQDEGLVFRKVISQDEVYQAREQDKELRRVTKDIVREDSGREKYAEKGCHVLHILSCVRQTYSRNVSKSVIEMVLRCLERDSEIFSTIDQNHYKYISVTD